MKINNRITKIASCAAKLPHFKERLPAFAPLHFDNYYTLVHVADAVYMMCARAYIAGGLLLSSVVNEVDLFESANDSQ